MARSKRRTVLSHLSVKEAMRRQVIQVSKDESIEKTINYFIKYKVNALLTTDPENRPLGVVSKTDIMGAYYAGLPIDYPVESIMSSPPLFCDPYESLEAALDRMKSKGIYRLYVRESDGGEAVGILAYPDIVGLLYLYCHDCDHSHFAKKKSEANPRKQLQYRVKDVMTMNVKSYGENDTLFDIMEGLSAYRFGAVLINASDSTPSGVVSKTDLILAYKHAVPSDAPAKAIMSSPVQSCSEEDPLEEAIRKMIFSEVHRLFVHRNTPREIVGVFSLSDAARLKSGSCRACVSSRIKVENHH